MHVTISIAYLLEMSLDNGGSGDRTPLEPLVKPDLSKDKTDIWLGSEHEVQKLFEFLGKVASRELTLVEAPELVEITTHNLAIKFALSCCLLEGLLAGAHEKE